MIRNSDDVKNFAPCVEACPAHIDIPGYIALCENHEYEKAVALIKERNPLPLTCGYVCVKPCELACRRNKMGGAVNIREIKRFLAKEAKTKDTTLAETGKQIAVVGGGPSGLSAAYYLRKLGHSVTIFEEREKLGGMLRYGIPAYRLAKDELDEEIAEIVKLGVNVKTNSKITTFASLKDYDAIYVAIGDQGDKKLGLEGEELEGVIPAIKLLNDVANGKPADFTGKKVVVIGAGNVAMDALRTAKRLNATEVSCIYRRSIEQMPANKEEIDDAISEGVNFLTLQAPNRVLGENGKVVAFESAPQELGEIGRDGRPAPRAIEGAEPLITPCDIVIPAIGQSIVWENDELQFDRSRIVVESGHKVRANIYAGGDALVGTQTVIKGIAEGREAALEIHHDLGFTTTLEPQIEVPDPRAPQDLNKDARQELGKRNPAECIKDFNYPEIHFNEETIKKECTRCLRCDRPMYIKK